MIKERQKELEILYLNVLEKFPTIKKDEIRLEYPPSPFCSVGGYAGISIVDDDKLRSENKIVIDPRIVVDSGFFDLSEGEKKAVIAHELGHYLHRMKHYNVNRIKRMAKWTIKVRHHDMEGLSRIIVKMIYSLKGDKRPCIKKLQRWNTMCEVYADNEAARAGYGNQMLAFIKRHPREGHVLSPLSREQLPVRIKNLENTLENEEH